MNKVSNPAEQEFSQQRLTIGLGLGDAIVATA
jgi:hypothetical protein